MPKQVEYSRLKPWYPKVIAEGITLHTIANEVGVSYPCALKYYGIYLRERFDVKERKRAKLRKQEIKKDICPTCGKHKHEVSDESQCRDIIHFS